MAEDAGIKMILTNDKLIKTEFTPGHIEDKPLMSWKVYLKDIFVEKNFDFVVADFFSFPATYLADELNITNIIYFPGPLGMIKYVGVNFPQSENQSLLFGSIIQTLSFETFLKNFILKMAWNSSVRIRSYQNFLDRVVLVNSFWGLDQPY